MGQTTPVQIHSLTATVPAGGVNNRSQQPTRTPHTMLNKQKFRLLSSRVTSLALPSASRLSPFSHLIATAMSLVLCVTTAGRAAAGFIVAGLLTWLMNGRTG